MAFLNIHEGKGGATYSLQTYTYIYYGIYCVSEYVGLEKKAETRNNSSYAFSQKQITV